ncbi:MAG TPA: PLP-dependent aminotransferase family protein [Gemmatimonadaceae bacterium]
MTRRTASPELQALLSIDRRRRAPLYRQIYDGLRSAILEGLLRPGQRLPSTRVLALDIGASRLPVLSAYDQLLHEGYLVGRVGSGTFVSSAMPDETLRAGASSARARPGRPSRQKARALPPERDEGGLRPFRTSLPALDEFPHGIWARLVARRARSLTPAQMAYGDPAGTGALRLAIAEHVRTWRAVSCEAEQVLIVSGSQAALRLCATVLLGNGDAVAIEEPGYPGAHAALGATGAELIPIELDADGMDVTALENESASRARRGGASLRAAYLTPSHQYPLGAPMSAPRRLDILDWSKRRDAWLIEDDYDSEYRYVSQPLAALQGMGAQERVIYIGTFSKVLFPALRIGYVVVPPTLWEEFVAAREALDIFSPTLYQLALADFMNEGHFVRHIRRMRGVYLRRRAALLAGIARHCSGLLVVHNADAGLHVATILPARVDDVKVVMRLGAHGLTATPLSTCYIGPNRRTGLLLGFGGFSESQITNATQTLGKVLRASV